MTEMLIMTKTHVQTDALHDALLSLSEDTTIIHDDQLFLAVKCTIDEEDALDFDEFYHLLQTDVDFKFSLLTLPLQALNVFSLETLESYLNLVTTKSYTLETLLLKLIKAHPEEISGLQKKLVKSLDEQLIKSILALADADLNASIAAKNLYLHRNSLLYRIDKVYEETGINIKSFKGLVIFYLLFSK